MNVISSMAGSAEKSAEFFTRGSSISGSGSGSSITTSSDLAALFGSGSGSNSATTFDLGSSRTSCSTRAEGGSITLFIAWLVTSFLRPPET